MSIIKLELGSCGWTETKVGSSKESLLICHCFPHRSPRDYEVRERIPVPHDNYFQSLGNYNLPLSLKLNDVTLTDQ